MTIRCFRCNWYLRVIDKDNQVYECSNKNSCGIIYQISYLLPKIQVKCMKDVLDIKTIIQEELVC